MSSNKSISQFPTSNWAVHGEKSSRTQTS